MKKALTLILIVVGSLNFVQAQYKFINEKRAECTPVKSQDITGTCWSYSTASFLESELIRMGKGNVDLSEMFIVRNIYEDKAQNYMLRQGNAAFSQGGLAHDLIRMVDKVGVMPQANYTGLINSDTTYNHEEMEAGLKGFLDGVRTQRKLSKSWSIAFSGILDAYMGPVPVDFTVNGKKYKSLDYAKSLGLNAKDYVSFTSFSHHPFDEKFILELPDNYSNGSFYNLTLDNLMKVIDEALAKGYTLAWDGDVSEKGFQAKKGLAILPEDFSRDSLFTIPGSELKVTQENRQEAFESLETTDDHLMHMVGTATDANGTKYYIIKNSWGEISDFDGYLYMSEAYVRMKTVSVLLHKDGVPKGMVK